MERSVKKKISVRIWIVRIVLLISLLLTLLPAYVMIVNSFKTQTQLLDGVMWFSFPLHFKNYGDAFNRIIPYVWNSITVTVVSTLGITVIAAITGYAFGHYKFKGKSILFLFITINMMVPSVLTLVPSYMVVVKIGLLNSHFALLLPYMATGSVMGVFLVRGFVEQLPKEIFDAASIDGMNEYQLLVHIGAPLIAPILTTVSILALLSCWNDIVWPNLVLDEASLRTIPLGLLDFNQQQGANKGALFAGYIIASVPLLVYFVFNMKSFMDSLTVGAIK